MPVLRVTKKTEQLLVMKKKNTGLSKTKLVEFAVLNMPLMRVDHKGRIKVE